MLKNMIQLVGAMCITVASLASPASAAPEPSASTLIADFGSTKFCATYRFRHDGHRWDDVLVVEINHGVPGKRYAVDINGKRIGVIDIGAAGRGSFVSRDSGRIETDDVKESRRFHRADVVSIAGARDRFEETKR